MVHLATLWRRQLVRKRSLVDIIFVVSLVVTAVTLLLTRPAPTYFATLLLPVALAALLYELSGGLLMAVAALTVIVLLIAFEADPARRAMVLQEAGPILVMLLLAGPLFGWLATRERERARKLLLTGQDLQAEQARRYRAEHRRAQQLRAISDAARQIAATSDLASTLRVVMQMAAETLPLDAGAIFQFDQSSQRFQVRARINVTDDHARSITFALNEGVPGWVMSHDKALVITDAPHDQRVHPLIVAEGVLAVLAIPLVANHKTVGVLTLYSKTDENAFADEARQLAQIYADQAALFLENARLVDELRQAAADLEARVERRTTQLRASQTQMVQAEKLAATGRLAASVAHEVNNPLQAISLHLNLLHDTVGDDSDALTVIQAELARIAVIVRRLLDFQRPDDGQMNTRAVTDLLDDVLSLTGQQLRQAGVHVTCSTTDEAVHVLATGEQLKQVFLNIILNAVEAMPDGGRLRISIQADAGQVAISFQDSGSGMSIPVQRRLFEPFHTTKATGSGLGLAISHQIVTRHGGDLTVSSAPAAGATFIVSLPRADSGESV